MAEKKRVPKAEIAGMMERLETLGDRYEEARREERQARSAVTSLINQINGLKKEIRSAMESWDMDKEVR